VHVGRFKLSGPLAWWFWLAAHVYFLIGFRNRFVVLVNWAMAYWSYQRAARIIFGQAPRETVPDHAVQDLAPEPKRAAD
jgi:NADH dehydrogenase